MNKYALDIRFFRSAFRKLFPEQSELDKAVTEKRLLLMSRALLVVAVAIPLLGFMPELIYLTPDLNDGAFHLGVARNTIEAVREGANPLDFWVPTWLGGFPLFNYYQPGPYSFIALLHFLSAGAIPLLFLYRLITVLAIVAFPLANYRALRWLELSPVTAAWGAFLSTLISAHGKYGIEFESFTWSGWGLFTQLVALPILPLALAGGYRAIKEGRRTIKYVVLFALALLSHILYGYIAALSLLIIPFLNPQIREIRKKIISLIRFGLQSFCLVAFFVVPLVMYRAYHLKSLYDEASKFDSHGAAKILTWLFSGAILDSGRLPVMTCLAFAGIYLCARKWLGERSYSHGWIACGFVFWLFLYFGRATWGSLIDLLPMSHGLHFERLSSGVHIFALWLAAIAIGSLSRWALGFKSYARSFAGCLFLCVLILPVVIERSQYLIQNTKNVEVGMELFKTQQSHVEPILNLLKDDPEGRTFAGHSGDWGKAYDIGSVPVYQILSAEAVPLQTYSPFSWSLSTDVGFQFSPSEWESYDLYNVRYLLTNQAGLIPPRSELLLQSGQHRLFRIQGIEPFSIVTVPLTVVGGKDTTPYLLMGWAKGLWSRKHAVVHLAYEGETFGVGKIIEMEDLFHFSCEGQGGNVTQNVFDPPALFMTEPPSPPSGKITDVFSSRQEAKANIHLDAPGVVLFKATYHPNWRAELDGKRVATMLLSPGFVGVRVPEGDHRLYIAYKSGWLKILLLFVGIIAAFGIDFFSRRGEAGGAGSEG
jgi:hypothetical protein